MQQIIDTISAIATPSGSGGMAVIRISGEKAFLLIHTEHAVSILF